MMGSLQKPKALLLGRIHQYVQVIMHHHAHALRMAALHEPLTARTSNIDRKRPGSIERTPDENDIYTPRTRAVYGS